MPRPSQQLDQALLAAGRRLYPQLGCGGMSSRAVAAEAGTRVGMLHYHFGSMAQFQRALLQQIYEEMFASLQLRAAGDAPAALRLRGALLAMARFARAHRPLLTRVWVDALAGHEMAREFFRANAPRHLGLLFGLLREAQADGALNEAPLLQRFVFLMGSVLMPMIFAAGLVEVGVGAPLSPRRFQSDVMSDAAIGQRIDWALAALGTPPAAGPRKGGRR